jgi:hypothetical protein
MLQRLLEGKEESSDQTSVNIWSATDIPRLNGFRNLDVLRPASAQQSVIDTFISAIVTGSLDFFSVVENF